MTSLSSDFVYHYFQAQKRAQEILKHQESRKRKLENDRVMDNNTKKSFSDDLKSTPILNDVNFNKTVATNSSNFSKQSDDSDEEFDLLLDSVMSLANNKRKYENAAKKSASIFSDFDSDKTVSIGSPESSNFTAQSKHTAIQPAKDAEVDSLGLNAPNVRSQSSTTGPKGKSNFALLMQHIFGPDWGSQDVEVTPPDPKTSTSTSNESKTMSFATLANTQQSRKERDLSSFDFGSPNNLDFELDSNILNSGCRKEISTQTEFTKEVDTQTDEVLLPNSQQCTDSSKHTGMELAKHAEVDSSGLNAQNASTIGPKGKSNFALLMQHIFGPDLDNQDVDVTPPDPKTSTSSSNDNKTISFATLANTQQSRKERDSKNCVSSFDFGSPNNLDLEFYSNIVNSGSRKEICTQTDEGSLPNSQQCTCSQSRPRHNSRPQRRSQNIDNRSQEIFLKPAILSVLSQDITLFPNGCRRFNNIGQIGTVKWLERILPSVGPHFSTKGLEQVAIPPKYIQQETDLNLPVYRFRNGKTRIYSLRRNDTVEELNFEEDNIPSSSEAECALRLEIDKLSLDKSLRSCDGIKEKVDKNKIIPLIHDFFAQLYDILENDRIPSVQAIQMEGKYTNYVLKDGRFQLKEGVPLKTLKNNRAICFLLYLMGKIYTMLQTDNRLTNREIYYEIKHLIKCSNLSYIVRNVTAILNVGQWDLNIISQNGLVFGDLKLHWSSGEITDCSTTAILIPSDVNELVEIHSSACFILVLEKESIFRKLLEENLPNKLSRPFIMITGRGMSKFNVQLFLKRLTEMMQLPIFVLTDADVYGIRIMMTYRFGSLQSAHLSHYLAAPNVRWLGVFPSEISTFGITHMKIAPKEKRLLNTLMAYPCMESHPKILKEVKFMAEHEKKASIEAMIKNNTFLSESYLPVKFFNKDFI